MDTVEKVMRVVNPDDLEKIKASLIQALIKKQVFSKMDVFTSSPFTKRKAVVPKPASKKKESLLLQGFPPQ